MNIQLKTDNGRKILQTDNEYIVKDWRQIMHIQLNGKILQTDNEYHSKRGRYYRQIMNIQLKRKVLQTDNEYIVKEEDTADR